mmetsp:Transcript_67707/g.185643  ORF Transcript_67707/g.185643 Transcript_67707/m.185643 type:complete len:212 (+) Transcript_67707:1577-2212(+)
MADPSSSEVPKRFSRTRELRQMGAESMFGISWKMLESARGPPEEEERNVRLSFTGCSSSFSKYQMRCGEPYRSSSDLAALTDARWRSSSSCGCGSASRRKTASCSTSDATTKSSIDCKNEGSIATSTSSKRQETSSYQSTAPPALRRCISSTAVTCTAGSPEETETDESERTAGSDAFACWLSTWNEMSCASKVAVRSDWTKSTVNCWPER